MSRRPLKGMFPLMPLVLKDSRELDLDGLRENINAFEEAGFDGYIALGSMGEFFATDEKEFDKIVDVAVDATKKITCVFGTTWHNTTECLRRTKYAEDAGADGVMIGPPYFMPCTENDVYEHYRLVDENIEEIQVMAYNHPPSFHFNMTPRFWDKLTTLPSITAVKESNGDLLHRIDVIKHLKHKINVYSGDEVWLLDDALHGANSVVSTCGTGAPKAALAYYNACMQKDLLRAIPLNHGFVDMSRDCTPSNEAAWLKASAEIGGFKAGPPRPPYAPVSEEIRVNLRKLIEAVNALLETTEAERPAAGRSG
jgi:4-hydroxy-tetrahydrodipicolinate synthase